LSLLLALCAASCAGVSQSNPFTQPPSPVGAAGPSALAAAGPAAASIDGLWRLMLVLGTVIYVGVMAYLLWAVFRRRRRAKEPLSDQQQQRIIVWGGAVMPAVVVLVVFGATLATLRSLPAPGPDAALTIDVTGYQWWWEVHYGELGVTTANEIHIPVGQPVDFRLTSRDVIHSFWVPQLHGKLDLNPGHVTVIRLEADAPGNYWGECAEYCGIQHAQMRFVVVAETPEAFGQWVERMQQPAAVPSELPARRGLDVFLSSNCIFCHRVDGTDATGELGPDLTHVASRLTLGAGAAPNTRGSLGGWVADPHSLKPGVLMPPSDLSGEELQALLAYLETLE
jgi:cytochrome c oxidase subunit 2